MGMAKDSISNEPFRKRFEELKKEGWNSSDVANWLGWEMRGKPDERRVRRVLGLTGKSTEGVQQTVRYDLAVKLCNVLGIDYWEVGV